jgi:transcriptional regulator with XRE-family HTH domain
LGKTLQSPRHKALIEMLVAKREAVNLTQADLAEQLGEYQSFVARLESGQRRVDVVEFIRIAEVLKFNPAKAVSLLQSKHTK